MVLLMEKRKNRRHSRRLRVRFGEADFTQQGFSSDVSATGMFVQTSSIPKVGTRVHIEVTFDGEQRLFFEGVVARQKIVAAELRHVMKGGFGVRFLAGVDLLPDLVPNLRSSSGGIAIRYETKAAFAEAWRGELQRGGAFVWSEKLHPVNSIVPMQIDLPFVNQQLSFDARVMHLVDEKTRHGLTLMFVDVPGVLATLKAIADAEAI